MSTGPPSNVRRKAVDEEAAIMSIPTDLMLCILCFVQRDNFYNLIWVFKTCKAWNELVKERRLKVGCVRLHQKALSIYQSFDTVYVPTRYNELIEFWKESEYYFQKLLLMSINVEDGLINVEDGKATHFEIPLTSSFTSTFDPTFTNYYADMMIGIINKVPATVWKLQKYKKLAAEDVHATGTAEQHEKPLEHQERRHAFRKPVRLLCHF